jgi:Dynamin GTPase effector domain
MSRVLSAIPLNQTLQPPPVGLERLFGGLPENARLLTSEELFQMYKQDKDIHVLEIVANTAAYFRVACKRVIDIVPMCIENEFLLMFSRVLEDNLEKDLGLLSDDAAEICNRFTAEEPDANERRENLASTKATISEGLKIIGELTTARA